MIRGEGFTINESKFDYFFGRVTSDPDNTQRSLQNLRELNRLGIDEAAGGRERLLQIFQAGLNAPEVIEYNRNTRYGISIARQVEVSSEQATGVIIVFYFYPQGDLNAIPQVTSIIPKIYQ